MNQKIRCANPTCRHLFPLPSSFPNTLAIFSMTVSMIVNMRIWKKKTSTGRIGTSDLLVHGSPPMETINLMERSLQREEQEPDPKYREKLS